MRRRPLCNTQSDLHPLEEGKHAAESGMDLKAYAEATGKESGPASDAAKRFGDAGEIIAYLVNEQSRIDARLLSPDKPRTLHLVEIKQSPRDLCPMLAGLLVEHEWSVKDTKAAVERINAAGCPSRLIGQAYQARRLLKCDRALIHR